MAFRIHLSEEWFFEKVRFFARYLLSSYTNNGWKNKAQILKKQSHEKKLYFFNVSNKRTL